MRSGNILAIASILAVLGPAVRAAQETAPRVMGWKDCVLLAAQENPELLSARRAVEAARSRRLVSFNGLLPSLSLSKRLTDSKSASGDSRWQADGTASLDLLSMGNYARLSGADAAVSRAEADLRLQSADLRLALRKAFTELLFAQEVVAVSNKIREIRRQNSDLVSLKYDSGRESKGNMLRAKAESADAQAALSAALRSLRASQAELGRQIGLDAFSPLQTAGGMDPGPMPPSWDPAALAARHPLAAQREAAVAAARAGLRESKSGLWPTLSASYSKSFRGRSYFPPEPSWSAAGVLSLPLFGGGPTALSHGISAAGRDLERSEQGLRAARAQVQSALEAAWAGLAQSLDQLKVRELFLEAALQRNEEASVRYSSGLMTFENWELVVADLVDSERGVVRSRRDAMLAEAQWDRAAGLSLEE